MSISNVEQNLSEVEIAAIANAFKFAITQKERARTELQRANADRASLEHLKAFVKGVLGDIGDEDIREALLTEPALRQWQNVFTSDSYDPVNNYQLFEIIGDAVLNDAFLNYMVDLYPDSVNTANLTRSLNYYMSYKYQVELGQKMGLDKMILTNKTLTDKTTEDVFEAFFGALQRITDNIMINGERAFENEGYGMASQLLRRILGPIDLIVEADPIVQIKERFDVLAQPSPVVKTTMFRNPDGSVTIKLELIQYIDGIPDKWAELKGPDRDAVQLRRRLGEMGLKIMDERGLTKEYIQNIRAQNEQGAKELERQELIFKSVSTRINREMIPKYNSSIVGHRFETTPQKDEFIAKLIIMWKSGDEEEPAIATVARGSTIIESEVNALKAFNDQYV